MWQASLKELRPLQIEVIQPASKAAGAWGFFISRYHYLGLHVVGENMGYLIKDREGRELSCLLFGAAAWRCAARDQWIGWKRLLKLDVLRVVVTKRPIGNVWERARDGVVKIVSISWR